MTKTEAIRYLESQGWRFKNKKRAVVSIADAMEDTPDWTELTTAELVQFAQDEKEQQDRYVQANEPEPIHNDSDQPTATTTTTTTLPVLERDTQAIAEAIEKACRIIVAVAVACYVAGFTLGTWVHRANAWLVMLHRRECKDRLAIVAGYMIDGILYTGASLRAAHATIREVVA